MSSPSAEQQARDLLERLGVPDAQSYSAGELVELANVINDAAGWRKCPATPRCRNRGAGQ